MIRGYSIQQQLDFLKTQYNKDVSQSLLTTIPDETRLGLQDLKPIEWYPRQYSVDVLRAIASNSGEDEAKVEEDLLRCGTFIATEATNTFLKLLMKILTPALFFKKIPEFWARDQKGGQVMVDTSGAKSGHIQLTISDVEGFDHIGLVSLGWMHFGMQSMGKNDVRIEQQGWSLKTPGPESIRYDVHWG